MRSSAPALMPIFRSRYQAELLARLLLHPQEEYPMSELARMLDVPLSTLHREVQRLEEAGLVTSSTLGRSRLVSANTNHRATRALTELLEMSFGPQTVVAEEFATVGQVDRVVIFGSWAARYLGASGAPPRDVDVLVVGAADRGEVYEAADRVQERLGIEVNPMLRSREQWEAGEEVLVAQIQASAYVTVLPDPAGESGS